MSKEICKMSCQPKKHIWDVKIIAKPQTLLDLVGVSLSRTLRLPAQPTRPVSLRKDTPTEKKSLVHDTRFLQIQTIKLITPIAAILCSRLCSRDVTLAYPEACD